MVVGGLIPIRDRKHAGMPLMYIVYRPCGPVQSKRPAGQSIAPLALQGIAAAVQGVHMGTVADGRAALLILSGEQTEQCRCRLYIYHGTQHTAAVFRAL